MPKAWYSKQKTGKLYFSKIEYACSFKDTVKRINEQATDWKKIFTKYISAREHVSPPKKLYYIFSKLNIKKQPTQFKNREIIWTNTSPKMNTDSK